VAFTQLASETEGGSQGVDLLDLKQQVTFAENAMVAAKGEMLTLIAAGASDDAVRAQKVSSYLRSYWSHGIPAHYSVADILLVTHAKYSCRSIVVGG
jgi:hypothetical protein